MTRLSSLLFPVITAVAAILWGSLPTEAAPGKTASDKSLKAAYYRQKYPDPHIDAHLRLAYLDSLIALRPSDIEGLLEKKIELCYERGLYSEVIEACDIIYQYAGKMDAAKLCRYMAMQLSAFSNSGNYGRLAETAPRLLELPKPDSLCYYDADVYARISNQATQLKSASDFSYIQKVETLLANARRNKMSDFVITKLQKSLLEIKADSASSTGDLDLTLKFQEQLLRLPLARLERLGVEHNIGMTYLQMGEDELALDIFRRILSEKPSHRNYAMALANAMHILNNQGRYKEALALYDANQDAGMFIDRYIGMAYLYANRGISLAGTGDYKEAFSLMNRAMEINDSIRISMGYREGDIGMNLAILKKDASKLSQERASYRLWMWIGFALLVISLCALAVAIRKMRKDTRTRKRLKDDRDNALERNRKTTSDVLKLARVNESMEQIDAICRDKNATPQMKLESIRHQIDNVAMLENSWEVFRHNFEGVHSGFFRRLKEKHPDISDSEMRMCAYVVMHLSSKDIAALTSRTIRSVESMRYRIQKKTGISGKDSLADYLLSLTAAD